MQCNGIAISTQFFISFYLSHSQKRLQIESYGLNWLLMLLSIAYVAVNVQRYVEEAKKLPTSATDTIAQTTTIYITWDSNETVAISEETIIESIANT